MQVVVRPYLYRKKTKLFCTEWFVFKTPAAEESMFCTHIDTGQTLTLALNHRVRVR